MTDLKLNIYLSGVGGQGIGLLSETLMRAYDRAGYPVRGVDTHGLAQRGGMVESHLRVGYAGGSPLIEPGRADLVLSLERTEALRAMSSQLRKGGALAFYDTLWQPLPVRLGEAGEATLEDLKNSAGQADIRILRVHLDDLPDVRMQNMALLGAAFHGGFLPGLKEENLKGALEDLMEGGQGEANRKVLENSRGELL
jgi:indolepyruvate ferredoxin oxidoreductase beta subunit